jgi:membrane-associated phospholipid phosphatase
MKKYFWIYIIAYLLVLTVVLGLLSEYPKLELHLLLNAHHTPWQDTFFRYYSTLAEWPFYVLALLPLCWKKWRLSLFYALCEATSGVTVQVLKHLFTMPRPAAAFEGHPDMVLPVVEGVRLHSSNSFPSGHTATFFVFITCCALLLTYYFHQRQAGRDSSLQPRLLLSGALVLLVVLAALGGYSRIYLSQHFLSDVCVGSIIGVAVPCLLFYFVGYKILKLK